MMAAVSESFAEAVKSTETEENVVALLTDNVDESKAEFVTVHWHLLF